VPRKQKTMNNPNETEFETELCRIAARLNCDKCPQIGHDYTPVYSRIIPRTVKTLLEIGIGSQSVMRHIPWYLPGAGLRMWSEWCPLAQVYGVDIDTDCANVTGDRIHVAIADATTEEVFPEVETFDVIIDDGSHETRDQLAAFALLRGRLSPGGVYVIEDVRQPSPLMDAARNGSHYSRLYEFSQNPMTGDNRLVVIYA
jgi:SAM-dependent methyltransferase